MFLAARLQRGCREIESGAPGTKAPDEKKTLIAALKHRATRKLRYCHSKLQSLPMHAWSQDTLDDVSRSFGNVAPASFHTSRYNRRGDFLCHPLPIKLAFPAAAVCLH
jgi:hypothetical protein